MHCTRKGSLSKNHPLTDSLDRVLYRMEFVDVFERTTDDQNGECNEQGRSLRQRIIAAQIRDSEVGLEELALTDGDNFDASVENKVSANESMLMEMDEIITQIRLWRSTISLPEESEIEGEGTNVEYTSTAYDRLFHSEIVHPEGPECEEEPSSGKFVHIADIDMAAKLKSLQGMIQDSKSAVSLAAHEKHVQEYSALLQLLRSKFGIDMRSAMQEEDSDSSDTDSNNSDDDGGDGGREGGDTTSMIGRAKHTSHHYNPYKNSNHNNNNMEEGEKEKEKGLTCTPRLLLESQFQAIDLEVKHSDNSARRAKEDEVIQEGADLGQAVWSLEDSLRDFTEDLDRLLQS